MVKKQKHTPVPWTLFSSNGVIEVQEEGSPVPVVNWHGFDDSSRPADEHEANAEFIVRAVNNHDDLVAVLTWLIGACKSKGIKLDSARKILAKATTH